MPQLRRTRTRGADNVEQLYSATYHELGHLRAGQTSGGQRRRGREVVIMSARAASAAPRPLRPQAALSRPPHTLTAPMDPSGTHHGLDREPS